MTTLLPGTRSPAAAALTAAAILFLAPLALGLAGRAAASACSIGLIAAGTAAKALARPHPRDPWLLVGIGLAAVLAPLALGFLAGGWPHISLGLAIAAAGGWALRPVRSGKSEGWEAIRGEGALGNQ